MTTTDIRAMAEAWAYLWNDEDFDSIRIQAYREGFAAALASSEVSGMREALRCNAVNPKRGDIMKQSEEALSRYDSLKEQVNR